MTNVKTVTTAVRALRIGLNIFTIIGADLDNDHKAKGPEARIETKAKFFTTKAIEVNELKGSTGAGGVKILHVNGGPGAITMPAAQPMISEIGDYKGEAAPEYIADYDVAADICNTANEGELIRLRVIQADINSQIDALKSIIASNNQKREFYNIED